MKVRKSWAIAPTALALALAIVPAASSNPVQTPLASPVVVTGSSGGSQPNDSCRGFMFSDTPSQVVRVTEANTSLRFRLQGNGQLALLIAGPGNPLCVPGDASGNGIEVPGVWQPGTYSLFVGERATGGNPFTLSITQEN